MPCREIADVESGPPISRDLGHLPFGQEPLCDPALIEDLDGARVQSTRTKALDILVQASFDDGGVDSGEPQLGAQRQACRSSARNDHLMLGHQDIPSPFPAVGRTRSPRER
jgi:hypothetical protein